MKAKCRHWSTMAESSETYVGLRTVLARHPHKMSQRRASYPTAPGCFDETCKTLHK